ncbi:ubiquitin carboxyl-terminal hydrolase 40 isoform X2 [Bufo bufo]|uniref:ubiquitin carboxyl-terminal hydrolase 40 isoform X2 n=1 Tax=Bufo bufo TaxID=8384 RepID=UPI001ABE1E57|nr:ubiquitin carboxyl-terminal hydrolase 40 isoform X2 [Bufo bufo]
MFGDLFEEDEDFSFLSSSTATSKTKSKDSEILEPRGETRLSGLRNQGSTCYLNSLLQTLLFTPEFREALFALSTEELGTLDEKDVPDSKVRIIPLQLQRLFAQLLLVDQQAASTSDLTSSFGWDNNEQTGQHDVQELNRILFSALESSLEGTSGHDLIKNLYHGTIVNRIQCQECGHVSERQEDFLDLTVAVKDMGSLEESLCSMYVEEEIFDGDNLYRCGSCNKLVPAAKSAKLRKLPPFLTISLLRFNFDFTKCERYKETSRYTFPTRLNIRPFCEQNHLEDSVQTYELFSVIIHKGGCYGGHYHVYIRDVDELGHWSFQEEKKSREAGDMGDEQDCPAVILATIIAEAGVDKMVPMDQLSQKLLEHTGFSWNRAYRKQHGALRKFLQNHTSIFQLSSDGSMVGLAHSVNGTDPQCCKPSNTGKMAPPQRSCSHWFDFNDSAVQCIHEKGIEKQFQGKESAYMLFYRKSQLKRPQEAKGNAWYGVPEYLLHQMDQLNEELQQKRLESDRKANCMNLRLHLSSCYRLNNGALHPVTSQGDATLDISVDQRGTVGDLRQTVFQLLDPSVEGHVLSIAKLLPAGLHVFQDLCDAEQNLVSVGVHDGCDIFVWNGKQVGGLCVQSGADCAPLLLTIMRPCQTESSSCSQKYSECQRVFPSNFQLRDLQQTLAGSPSKESLLCSPSTETSEGWSVFAMEDMNKTLKMLGLRDGSSLLLLDSHEEGEMVLAAGKEMAVDPSLYYIQVQDWYSTGCEKRIVQITADPDSTMLSLRRKAAELLGLEGECGEACLRPVHKSGKLLPPVSEHSTVQEADIKAGRILGLCRGRAPNPSEVFLSFVLATDLQEGQEQDIILDETVTVKECLDQMLQKAGLPSDAGWHLRRMDWCYEAGDALTEEDSSLKDLKIRSGDIFVITEGRLPPKGFLKLGIWLYCTKTQQNSMNHVVSHPAALLIHPSGENSLQADVESEFCFVCHIEISKDASLQDLKFQIMTLTVFDALGIPSPEYLRVWTLDNKGLGKLLRLNHVQISDCKLGSNTTLCVEPLQVEEILGPQDILLRIQLSVPGECRYFPPVDIAWNISNGCTASALRQKIATHCSLPVDKVEIAKYFPDKHEWLPISSWTQQVSKKKKKKKADNLQVAPYNLKDGDIIGVKNLFLDDRVDFSSEADFIAKEKQRQIAEDKKKSSALCSEKVRPSVRKTEASLSIRVGVFR